MSLFPFENAVRSKQVTRPRGTRPECELVPVLRDEADGKVDGAKQVSSSFPSLCPEGHTCCEQSLTAMCGYPSVGRGRRSCVRGRGRVRGECACRGSG